MRSERRLVMLSLLAPRDTWKQSLIIQPFAQYRLSHSWLKGRLSAVEVSAEACISACSFARLSLPTEAISFTDKSAFFPGALVSLRTLAYIWTLPTFETRGSYRTQSTIFAHKLSGGYGLWTRNSVLSSDVHVLFNFRMLQSTSLHIGSRMIS